MANGDFIFGIVLFALSCTLWTILIVFKLAFLIKYSGTVNHRSISEQRGNQNRSFKKTLIKIMYWIIGPFPHPRVMITYKPVINKGDHICFWMNSGHQHHAIIENVKVSKASSRLQSYANGQRFVRVIEYTADEQHRNDGAAHQERFSDSENETAMDESIHHHNKFSENSHHCFLSRKYCCELLSRSSQVVRNDLYLPTIDRQTFCFCIPGKITLDRNFWKNFSEGIPYKVFHGDKNHDFVVLKNAKAQLGRMDLGMFNNNCEHFVEQCHTTEFQHAKTAQSNSTKSKCKNIFINLTILGFPRLISKIGRTRGVVAFARGAAIVGPVDVIRHVITFFTVNLALLATNQVLDVIIYLCRHKQIVNQIIEERGESHVAERYCCGLPASIGGDALMVTPMSHFLKWLLEFTVTIVAPILWFIFVSDKLNMWLDLFLGGLYMVCMGFLSHFCATLIQHVIACWRYSNSLQTQKCGSTPMQQIDEKHQSHNRIPSISNNII